MEKYKRLRVLGTGAFSKVFLVQDGETGEHLVVKQIEASLSAPDRERALQEVALLRVLHHPNIISYRDAFVTRVGHICLIMEFAEGGDLHQVLQNQRMQGSLLSEHQVLDWFLQLCNSLQYLHGLNVIHRDIKARNIFLRSSGIVQLGDFGISTVAESSTSNCSSAVGTPTYASPERVRRRPYGASADIWSLGIVVYELCALRRPFEAEVLSALAERILSGEYAPLDDRFFSPDLRCVVTRMLAQEPDARPTALELLGLPLLRIAAGDDVVRTGSGEMETVVLSSPKYGSPSSTLDCRSAPSTWGGPPAAPRDDFLQVDDFDSPVCVPEMALPEEANLGMHTEDSPRSPKPAWTVDPARHSHKGPGVGHALLHGARRLLGFERGSG